MSPILVFQIWEQYLYLMNNKANFVKACVEFLFWVT